MLKVIRIAIILLIMSTTACFSQKRRAKRLEKQRQQEQQIQEEESTEEEEEIPEEYDQEEVEGEEEENQDLKNKSEEIKEGQSVFKRKSPSKTALLLERFQFNFSSGYGLTSWKSGSYAIRHNNSNDNSSVKYKGLGLNIPFHLQLLFDFGKIRLGAGASMELYYMNKLKPKSFGDSLSDFSLNGIGTFKKIYGHIGYKYFENRMYDYIADLEVGVFKGNSVVNTAGNSMRPFVNLGITLERKYSEYFRMFIKPAIEYKTQPYALTIDNFPVNNHKLLSFYVLWGVSYTIPMVAKCPIRSCGVRVHHYHGGRIFRGNPFHRLQNPDYGEEDRKFIRSRGKNKRKMDPY